MIIRAAVASGTAALAVTVPPPPTIGVSDVVIFGVNISLGTALLAAGGALLVRLVIGSYDGWKRGDLFLTVFLMLLSAILASDAKVGPGTGLILGSMLGAGGMAIVGYFKSSGVSFLKRFIVAYKAAATDVPQPAKKDDSSEKAKDDDPKDAVSESESDKPAE